MTPRLGDDLTNSEDIFLGMGMLNEGYRNIQLTDVYARTVEPTVDRLPRQVYPVVLIVPAVVLLLRRAHAQPAAGLTSAGNSAADSERTNAVRVAAVPALAQAGALSAPGGGMTTMLRTSTGVPRARRCGAPTGRPARETGAGL